MFFLDTDIQKFDNKFLAKTIILFRYTIKLAVPVIIRQLSGSRIRKKYNLPKFLSTSTKIGLAVCRLL